MQFISLQFLVAASTISIDGRLAAMPAWQLGARTRLIISGAAGLAMLGLLFRVGCYLTERQATAQPAAAASAVAAAAAPAVAQQGLQLRSPYVSLCLSVKDEHADLPEWVEHHLSLGVGTIYVIDHGSQPPLSTVLGQHITSGAVQYSWLEGVPAGRARFYGDAMRFYPSRKDRVLFQLYAYDHCMELHRQKHFWMGFLDADEYIVLRPDFPDLPSLLRQYEQYGGLAVNWIVMGTSGHLTRPAAGVRASYTSCTPESFGINDFVKTFANLRYVLPTVGSSQLAEKGPHEFAYRGGAFAVDSKHRRMDLSRSPHRVHDEIKLYHYILRSREEFIRKVERGNGMSDPRPLELFDQVQEASVANCTELLRYVTLP